MKRWFWLVGLAACRKQGLEPLPQADIDVARAAPEPWRPTHRPHADPATRFAAPDPTTCLVASTFFGTDDGWAMNCPAIPQPLPADLRPCEIRSTRDADDVVFAYDADGRPLRVAGPGIGEQRFQWSDGRLVAIDTSVGRWDVTSDPAMTVLAAATGLDRQLFLDDGELIGVAMHAYGMDAYFDFTDEPNQRVSVTTLSFSPDPVVKVVDRDARSTRISRDGVVVEEFVYEDGRLVRVLHPTLDSVDEVVYVCDP